MTDFIASLAVLLFSAADPKRCLADRTPRRDKPEWTRLPAAETIGRRCESGWFLTFCVCVCVQTIY